VEPVRSEGRRSSEGRSSATRSRIIEATLQTVREEGFADTTARAIARRGGFNQALIFYHFGSVDRLLLEAFAEASARQVEKYREAAAEVSSLSDLVRIARRLHAEDLESGAVTAVTQMMAAASDPEQAGVLLDRFDAWIRLVEDAIERATNDHPLASVVPKREAAYAISALFLGIELMSRLDPDRSEAEQVFAMMEAIAGLIENLGTSLATEA
jgi:AcrR family transcriptional regulator